MKQQITALISTLKRRFSGLMPELLILSAALVTYLSIFDPAVYADDWPRIRDFVFHQLQLADWSSRRPFEETIFQLVLSIFGLNFRVQLVAQVLTIALCAILIYRLCKRVFPDQAFLALPTAILFLVYPVDYSRLWFTRNYHWSILLLVLFATFLLLDFAKKGKWWRPVLALGLFTFCLGAYDGELGLICTISLLSVLLLGGISLPRRAVLLLPLLLGLVFATWRLVFQPILLGVHDPYVADATFSPLDLTWRLLKGYPLFLEAWIHPFKILLSGISVFKMEAILGVCAAAAGLFALAFPNEERPLSGPETRKNALHTLAPLAVGLLLLAGGLFPGVVQGYPALDLNTASSRNNQFAILGGALSLAALISLGASLVVRRRGQLAPMVMLAVVPFFTLGVILQSWMQIEAHNAWSHQQIFWRQLFLVVPNLRDGATLVVVEKSAYPVRPFQRLALSVEWDVDSGIQALYANRAIHGTLYLPDFTIGGKRETRLMPDGVHGYDVTYAPYDQLVIVLYTPANDVLRLVEDPTTELELPFPVENYHPESWILADPPTAPARQIVH